MTAARLFVLGGLLLGLVLLGTQASAQPPAELPAEAAARAHFERGSLLLDADAWELALAEFQDSRRIFPSVKATTNVIVCLRRLERFPEALLTVEALLRDFPDLPGELRATAEAEAADLALRVATLEVGGGPIGATLFVDNREVGALPLEAPLQLNKGQHVIRATKEWHEPFEASLELAGGATTALRVHMRALANVGRLMVLEQRQGRARVVIDGAVVGRTPFEGLVAPGRHLIWLDGPRGSQPVEVVVGLHQVSAIALAAEALVASLRIAADPPSAHIVLDGVEVATGAWQGRVRGGGHHLEVKLDGYELWEESFDLSAGDERALEISLARDPYAEVWQRPIGVALELEGGLLVLPSFAGELGDCDTCDPGPAIGGHLSARVAVSFSGRFEVGILGGFLAIAQSLDGAPATIEPVGLPPRQGTLDEDVQIRGGRVGLFGGAVLGSGPQVHFRIGAGMAFGTLAATRRGTFADHDTGPYAQRHGMLMACVQPGVRLGWRPASGFELLGGLDVDILMTPSPPLWDRSQLIDAGPDGIAVPHGGTMSPSLAVSLTPVLGVRYTF